MFVVLVVWNNGQPSDVSRWDTLSQAQHYAKQVQKDNDIDIYCISVLVEVENLHT